MNDDAFWRIVIISVIVVIVIIVIIALIMIAVKSSQNGTVQPQPTPNPNPSPKPHKRCGCRSACDCDKKPTCPQCPACPDCPKCMPTCPSPCADCPTCPRGLGGSCTTSVDCVGGLTCVNELCTCVKPSPPLEVNAITEISVDPPGTRLIISWTDVPGADYYNIFIDGPSSHTFLFHQGNVLFTPVLAPGFYTITVFAGDNDCGTGSTSTSTTIVIPAGNIPCDISADCPGDVPLCNQETGFCVLCLSDDQCFGNTPTCNVDAGVCVPSVCTSNQQCFGNTPVCNVSSGICVQCLTNPDCPNGYICSGNTCVCSGVVPAPTVLDAFYTAPDTLFVSWTAVPTAISYTITFVDPVNPTPVCINSSCPYTVMGNVTSVTIPPGNAMCAPGPGSHVFVQVVTPCGTTTSQGFLLDGQSC